MKSVGTGMACVHRVPKGVIIPKKCDLVSVVTKSCATSREEILAKKSWGRAAQKKVFLARLFISMISTTFFMVKSTIFELQCSASGMLLQKLNLTIFFCTFLDISL